MKAFNTTGMKAFVTLKQTRDYGNVTDMSEILERIVINLTPLLPGICQSDYESNFKFGDCFLCWEHALRNFQIL